MARINAAYESLLEIWSLPPICDLVIVGPVPHLEVALSPPQTPTEGGFDARRASECYRAMAASASPAARLDLRA